MSRVRHLLVLLLPFALLSAGHIANNAWSQDKHKEFWAVVQTVQDILAGKNGEKAKAMIGRGSRLVCGVKCESLEGVVAGENKTCSLADTSYHGVAIQARTNPSEDMGLLVLKTQKSDTTKVRYHTVVFMKDSTGQFKIITWHTGGADQ